MNRERKSAKDLITNFVSSILVKIERGDSVHGDVIIQLQTYQGIAQYMEWIELEKRIKKAIQTHNERYG